MNHVGKYYCWFYVEKNNKCEQLEVSLNDSVESSIWVDGLNNQVYLCTKELQEIKEYLYSEDFVQDRFDSVNIMKHFMRKIIKFHDIVSEDGEFENEDDYEVWNFIAENILYDDQHRYPPIPVFSYVTVQVKTSDLAFLAHWT